MKKTSKRLMALLLTLVLAFSFTACKKDDAKKASGDNATVAPTQAASADPTVAATPTTAVEKYPAFDFGGRTIKFGIWYDYFYTSQHTKIEDNPGVTNTETAQMQLDNVRRIETKYNCRIEFVNLGWDGEIESINTSIAAGTPECDVYFCNGQFAFPAAANGLAQDLSTFVPATDDMFTTKSILRPVEALGGTYFFQTVGLETSGAFVGYNSNMIQELGLEDPQELYKKGEWNWDKFAEYALAGTRDTDGDGTVDVYGFGGVWTDLLQYLVFNNGGTTIAGTETEGLSSKNVTEVLDFMNRLFNTDKSARPWNMDDWNDNLLAWSSGKVMMFTGQAWLCKQEADAAVAAGAELPFEYRVVPYPAGPSSDGKVHSYLSGDYWMIPVGVKEPEKVFQIMEEFLGWHQGNPEFRDDPSWVESCFQRQEDVDMLYEISKPENQLLDFWGQLGSNNFDMGALVVMPAIFNQEKTVAQAVESAKPVLQDALDAFYGKK